jgi:alkylation response protein AidB-like acyl-CoA dehydrogenase
VSIDSTDVRDSFRRELQDLGAARASSAAVRAVFDDPLGYDTELWTLLSRQMRLPALLVPEDAGGEGLGYVEVGIVLEEIGARLAPVPFLASVIATTALLQTGPTKTGRELLAAMTRGPRVMTMALIDPAPIRVDAAGTLTGSSSFVLDGAAADTFLVPATDTSGHLGLYAVAADGPGVHRDPLRTLDLTRRQVALTLDVTPARCILQAQPDDRWLASTRAIAAWAVAAEQLGGIRRCLELSVEYAKARVAFGRAIGSFQAIKHKCADLVVELECTRVVVEHAARVADRPDRAALADAAAVAKAYASDAYNHASAELIQILGAIGFTWEHDAHLYFRRARSDEALFGSASQHRAAIARGLWGAA